MERADLFEPRWVAPPGATVLDLMRGRHMAIGQLASEVHKDPTVVSRFLHGIEPLTPDWAESLARIVGASTAFWLRREEMYRSDLKRLCHEASFHISDLANTLPLKDMVRFGWIEKGESEDETAMNACAFLGVVTTESFQLRYQDLLSSGAYRASSAFATQPSAVAVWLRQGEIAASAVDCDPWDSGKLRSSIDAIRALTREPDPAVFLPKLEALLADCGVALVIARAPSGCRASGAARFLNTGKGVIQLSFRYLSDDQFWFTLFHEIGHMLLHAKDGLMLEMDHKQKSSAESEADDFAINTLFAKVGPEALRSIDTTKYEIARLARKAGVSSGLVVGQLQAMARIPYKHFNYMKVRYEWEPDAA